MSRELTRQVASLHAWLLRELPLRGRGSHRLALFLPLDRRLRRPIRGGLGFSGPRDRRLRRLRRPILDWEIREGLGFFGLRIRGLRFFGSGVISA